MIPKAITAPFRWWAKHPRVVFWVITLFGGPFVIKSCQRLKTFGLPDDLSLRGTKIFVLAWLALWLGSFVYSVLVTWKRSKVGAVNAVLLSGILVALAIPQAAPMGPRPDRLVKSNIKAAATAQEAYFVKHNTYSSNIDSLKEVGYHQSANVTMGASATTTTFVITGTITEGCEANTGRWVIDGTTGAITGTRCRYGWP